jgi:hypothetical protein
VEKIEIVCNYKRGAGIVTLAKMTGRSRSYIERVILESGCEKRTKSEGYHLSAVFRRKQINELGHKVCSVCGEDKPLNEYYSKHKNSISWCKGCSGLKAKERRKRLKDRGLCPRCLQPWFGETYECDSCLEKVRISRREWTIKAIEYMGNKCKVCGGTFHYAAMVFHHRDPSKKEFKISYLVNKRTLTWEHLKKELEKCDLVCANCHNIIHCGSEEE